MGEEGRNYQHLDKNISLFHDLRSERMSAAERVSSAEQANERVDEQVAHY